MSRKLYLECYSGISGDMTVAALLDLGADAAVLHAALESLPVDGFQAIISRVKKAGLDVCDFDVRLDEEHENHDHDMDYLYGDMSSEVGKNAYDHNIMPAAEEHHHDHCVHHAKLHEHSMEEAHEHGGGSHEHGVEHRMHEHAHRGLSEILGIIRRAEITDHAKEIAEHIFQILAEAEAHAHGVEINEVHFHEVGAVDSIVDIIAVAVCADNLHIEEVIVPSIGEGQGFVRCQHGVIPVPVPAVTAIASSYGLVLHRTDTTGELVTPTGAAIVAALKTSHQLPQRYTIEKVGIGAGKRVYDRPSLLRAMIISDKDEEYDTIYKLESNIDDCTGEALGHVMDRLFENGARDVHYIPSFMKKNRPAYQINVICVKEDIQKLEQIIFEETTTIGIRRIEMERTVLTREVASVQTDIGTAQVKICRIGAVTRIYPEYASVIELCKESGLPYAEVYRIIQAGGKG